MREGQAQVSQAHVPDRLQVTETAPHDTMGSVVNGMPTYTYQCSKCSSQYERVQRISDPPDTVCPVPVGDPGGRGEGQCGGAVRRVIVPGGGGFILKGGGWYRDGY